MIHQALLSRKEIHQLVSEGRLLPPSVHASTSSRSGEQSSEGLGHGMDFADMRPYQAGDNPRRIDWRASARRQQTLLRLFHADTNTPCCLVIDRQASMRFGSRVRSKCAQAARIAIMLAAGNRQHGNPLSALIIDKKTQWMTVNSGQSGLQAFTQAVSQASPPLSKSAEVPLDWPNISSQIQQLPGIGSSLYLISDFLSLQATDKKALQQLGRTYRCHALQVVDPLEAGFRQQAGLQLQWGGRQLNSDSIHQLRQQQDSWQEQLETLLRKANISHRSIASDRDSLTPLLEGIST